jgi:hypothetical protein
MRYQAFFLAWVISAAAGSPSAAQSIYGGQYPAPPEVASQMALPLCGFAATKRWGSNGFQYCDARNVYPPIYPRAGANEGSHRGHRRVDR